jgi:MFS family permease
MTAKTKSQGALLAVLFFGVLMGALDIAIVAPALHPIQTEFGITPRLTAWVFSIYLLFSLVGTPMMAKLADLHGRRLVYIADIVLFAAGSLVVIAGGLTGQFWLFLTGRAVQGLGAGGIFPVASAVIGDTVAPEKRGSALGLIGAVWGLAFILGPILGGLLLPFGWPILFFINIPIALVLILFSLKVLPAHEKGNSPPLDLRALLLLGLALATFTLGVNQIDIAHPLPSFLTLGVWPFLVGGVVFLLLLIASERRKTTNNPLFPHHLFKNRQLTLVYLVSAIYGVAQSSFSFIPLLAMAAFGSTGLTAAQSSYLMMPMVLAMAVASPLVGRLLDKAGSKVIVLGGVTIASLGFLAMGLCSNVMPGFIGGELLLGFGLAALAGAPLRYIVLSESPAADRTVAQGLTSLFTSMGSVVGSAVIGGAAASMGGTWQAWASSFLVVAVPTVVAIGIALFLKPRQAELEASRRNHG